MRREAGWFQSEPPRLTWACCPTVAVWEDNSPPKLGGVPATDSERAGWFQSSYFATFRREPPRLAPHFVRARHPSSLRRGDFLATATLGNSPKLGGGAREPRASRRGASH